MLYQYLFGIVNAFDYGLSLLWSIFSLPYDVATVVIFGGSFSYVSVIFGNVYSFSAPYVRVISDIAYGLFNALFSWTTTLPFTYNFGICLVTGILGNCFTITVIHWCVKALGKAFSLL